MAGNTFESAFCTLEDAVLQKGLVDQSPESVTSSEQALIAAFSANEKALLKDEIVNVSRELEDAWEGRTFEPYQYTYDHLFSEDPLYNLIEGYNNSNLLSALILTLANEDDLLELDTLIWDGTTIASSDFTLLPGTQFPARRVSTNRGTIGSRSITFDSKIVLTGVWGYNNNPSIMFKQIDTLDAAMSTTTETTFTVDAGRIGLYETLSLLQIEDEYLRVTDANITTFVVTVERGVRGSTAATHVISTPVEVYQRIPSVVKAVRDKVIRIFNKRGGYGNIFASGEQTQESNTQEFALSIPKRVFWWSA